jgi:GntR family transcriptional regulator, transcriptional repressor for pyruvate dehydrogenase complex
MERLLAQRPPRPHASKRRKARNADDANTLDSLRPIQRPDLVRMVVERLGARIIAGEFDASGLLPAECRLGETYQVSRTVVREAMRVLAAQRLVEVSQGRRPRVRPVDSQAVMETFHIFLKRADHSLLDLIEVRRPLEATIAALAAQRATPDHIRAMEDVLREAASARGLKSLIEADLRFHELLAEATGNPIFLLLLQTLVGSMRQSRQKTIARSGVQKTILDHAALLEAVRRHDSEAARQTMLDHLTDAELDLRTLE